MGYVGVLVAVLLLPIFAKGDDVPPGLAPFYGNN